METLASQGHSLSNDSLVDKNIWPGSDDLDILREMDQFQQKKLSLFRKDSDKFGHTDLFSKKEIALHRKFA